jgi:tRNA A37 methylthiotransferase MiaB
MKIKQLYDFVKDVEFERLGVFTYSDEEGTTDLIITQSFAAHCSSAPSRTNDIAIYISEKHNRA